MPGTIFVDEDHDGNRITGLPAPTDGDEAATKEYVDSNAGGNLGTTIITGGGVAWTGTGFNYIISACVYLINGVQYSSAQTPVTLTAAHATLDRIDVFYADTSGLAGYITGSPAANPVAPSVDPATQIYLSFAYVVAASSTPSLTNEPLYLENTEWTYSDNTGNINPDSTSNPYAGTKDIEGTGTQSGNLLTLVKPSGTLLPTDYGSLLLQIGSKASWPNAKSLSIFWLNGTTVIGTAVTLKHGTFAFDSGNTTTYQQIVIPASTFNTGSQAVDRLRITVTGGAAAIGWYLDNIILQTGIGGGGGGGDFSTNTNVSVSGEVVVFANTVGKLGRRSTGTGLAKLTSGVLGTAAAGTDYLAPSAIDDTAYDATTWNGDTTHAPTKNAVRDKIESIGGGGTVTTTGSPATGNLTKFSGGTSITNGDLSGDVTTSGALATTIANSAVTYAKIQNVSANSKLLGSSASGSGAPPSELTLGTNLSMSGSTLNASGGSLPGGGVTSQVTGSNFTTSSTAAGGVDVTGLTFAASANGVYEIDVLLKIQSTTNTGMRVGLNFSAAGATGALIVFGNNIQTTFNSGAAAVGTMPTQAFGTVINLDCTVAIKSIVTIGANTGNITVIANKVTSGTATVYIGSRMTVYTLA